MPFTPFHLGPGLLIGLLLFKFMDLPTFLLASVMVDLEPFLVMLLGLNYPLHGFFHSFLGGSVAAIALALAMLKFRPSISGVMSLLRLEQSISPGRIWAASLLGVYTHVLLDSPLYPEMKPFYPLAANPLLSSSTFIGFEIYAVCTICFVTGIFLYTYRVLRLHSSTAITK